MTGQTPPPNWYADPRNSKGLRWWDGNQWTEHTQPPPLPPPPAVQRSQSTRAPIQLPPKDLDGSYAAAQTTHTFDGRPPSWFKRKRILIPAALLAIGAMGSLTDEGSEETAAGVAAEVDEPNALVLFGQIAEPSERSLPLASTSRSTTLSTMAPTTQATPPPTEPPVTTAAPTTALESTTVLAPTALASTTPLAPTVSSTSAPTETTPTTAAPTTQTTPAPTQEPTSTAAPTSQPEVQAVVDCHPAYSGCLPNLAGNALDCDKVPESDKPVTVYDPNVDPYGLDGDNDGFGCEP